MKRENYEKLREKIIEANPSIMELKPGCKFIYSYVKGSEIRIEDVISSEKDLEFDGEKYYSKKYGKNGSGIVYNNVKIIGRPITLEDCLIAIGDRNSAVNCQWQLNKPLDEQSDETKQYLFNILINK